VEVPQDVLHSLLADTSFCQGTDTARFVLTGSLLRLDESITAVGCDGRRIACETALLESPADKKMDVILPPSAVKQLLRLLSSDTPSEGKSAPLVSLHLTEKAAQFKFLSRHSFPAAADDETTVTTKLIDGAYPDYTKVIPKLDQGVAISRVDLLNCIKRVHLVSNTCTLIFSGQSLTIKAEGNKEVTGQATEMLMIPPCNPATLNFNPQLLIEALAAAGEDEVIIHVKQSEGSFPMVMKVIT
jgi:DNA polymerase-3 subunit beta